MVLKGRTPTKAEKEWMDSIIDLGCIVCLHIHGVGSPQRFTILTGRLKPGAILKQFPYVIDTIDRVLTFQNTPQDIHISISL